MSIRRQQKAPAQFGASVLVKNVIGAFRTRGGAQRLTVAVVVTAVIVGSIFVVIAGESPGYSLTSAVPNGNLLVNPSFEATNLSTWFSWQGTLKRLADTHAPDGSYVAQVSNPLGTLYSLEYDPAIRTTTAGQWLTAAAYVRAGSSSAQGKPITLVIRERNSLGTEVKQTKASGTLSASFQRLTISAITVNSGDRIDVYVSQGFAVLSDSFRADVVTLVGGAQPSATATPAPATPTVTPSPRPTATPTSVPSLMVAPLDAWSARLTFATPPSATRVQILRNGRLIDSFAVAGLLTGRFDDHLLWPSMAFTYELKAVDAMGQSVSDLTSTITMPRPSGSFPVPYSTASFWNQPVPTNPGIDPNSSAMVQAALVAYSSNANLNDTAAWGRAVAYANRLTTQYDIGCTVYGCGNQVSFRIPASATPETGSDQHLAIVEPDLTGNNELDAWGASYASSAWSAWARYLTSAEGWGTVCALGQHCNGATAAGFSLLGGVVRPEELAQGHIDHALFITTPDTRSGLIACPATHTDGKFASATALPEGARIQLDPGFNVDAQTWPAWEKTVAHALQKYGAYVGDTGGTVSITGMSDLNRGYNAWNLVGVPNSPDYAGHLSNLPWRSFRVLTVQQC